MKSENETGGQPQVGSDAGLAVGDGAELTICRSSQGHIELEMRTKLGAIKVRLTEENYCRLMFGQAHVSAEVVRYLPKRRNMETANVMDEGRRTLDLANTTTDL